MAEQILSQEEIDSLLGAMGKGEIDLNAETDNSLEVEAYDLTSRAIKLHDQYQVFDEIYDKFASILGHSLTLTLQNSIEVEFISTETMKFEKFISAFSYPTDFTSFSMDPLIGVALFVMEPSLVFPVIDCMFGGDGRPLETMRDSFTMIELRIMSKFAAEVLEGLEKAWKFVYPLKLSFKGIETKPEFIHVISPNDQVIVVLFTLKGKEFSGNMHLCIPYLMLEPIKDKLSSQYLQEKEREGSWGAEIKNLLEDAVVTIRAELGRTVRSVQNILSLKPNDILTLNTGPQDPVIIRIEDIPKYSGIPGAYKGNSSVQITSRIRPHGGMENHG